VKTAIAAADPPPEPELVALEMVRCAVDHLSSLTMLAGQLSEGCPEISGHLDALAETYAAKLVDLLAEDRR